MISTSRIDLMRLMRPSQRIQRFDSIAGELVLVCSHRRRPPKNLSARASFVACPRCPLVRRPTLLGRDPSLSSRVVDRIVEHAAIHCCVAIEDIYARLGGHTRARPRQVTLARQLAIYAIRKTQNASYPRLAQHFGLRDHTNAMHGVRRVERLIAADASVRAIVASLEEVARVA